MAAIRTARSVGLVLALVLFGAVGVEAQQRPLITQDPETIGAGRLLVEGGITYAHGQDYPVSGLNGNLWQLPTLGVSVGLSSIAEVHVSGGFYDHLTIENRQPASSALLVTATGDSTNDVEDFVISTKIRLVPETDARPAIGVWFATELPTASKDSGLGTDTFNFYVSGLAAKTVRSVRTVANLGLGILADPTDGQRQNHDVTYGFSLARAVSDRTEFVGELNGRVSTVSGTAYPGTESRSLLKAGARFTQGSLRLDAGIFFGLASVDPGFGLTAGFTWVVDAFKVP